MSFVNSEGKVIERNTAIYLSDGTKVTAANGLPVYSGISSAVAVTPSDTANLTKGLTKGVYVGGAGDLAVRFQDGTSATFTGLTVGTLYPISITRVLATGTTATNVLVVY